MRAGDPPRTRLVLRVIAIERSLRGLLLLAAGTYLLFHLSTDFGQLAERIIRSIDIDPRYLGWLIRSVPRLRLTEASSASSYRLHAREAAAKARADQHERGNVSQFRQRATREATKRRKSCAHPRESATSCISRSEATCLSAVDSIWRTRSRVTARPRPISSSVFGSPSPRPLRRISTSRSLSSRSETATISASL